MTMINPLKFSVTVLDAAGTPLGDGPIASVASADLEVVLDRVGSMRITVPATDPRAALLVNDRRMRLLVESPIVGMVTHVDAYIRRVSVATGGLSIVAEGPLIQDKLGQITCGVARVYNNVPVADVIASLVAGTGMTATVDAGLGNISARFDGASRLAAILSIADKLGLHVRPVGGTGIAVGAFGADSGKILTNIPHLWAGMETNNTIIPITELEYVSESSDVVNMIIPLGAGDGDSQLTLAHVTDPARAANIKVMSGFGRPATQVGAPGLAAGDNYLIVANPAGLTPGTRIFVGNLSDLSQPHEVATILTQPTWTGTAWFGYVTTNWKNTYSTGTAILADPQFYIEDAALHGSDPREAVLAWKDIAPVDGTDANVAAAAHLLFDAAWNRLQRLKQNTRTFRVRGAKYFVMPLGNKVRVTYRGYVMRDGEPYKWIDIDELMYVTRRVRSLTADGSDQSDIEVSTTPAASETSDTDASVSAIQETQVWRNTVQLTPVRFNHVDTAYIDTGNAARFEVDLDDGIVTLDTVKLRLQTQRNIPALYILGGGNAHAVSINDSGVLYSADDVPHLVETQNSASSGSDHPSGLRIFINGQDYTSRLGGPWGSGTPVDVVLDITEALKRAASTVKSRHVLTFTCTGNRGQIKLTTKVQATVQSVTLK